MKCNDCGQEKPVGKYGTRPDVCAECWENRGWVLSHAAELGMVTVHETQRKMAAGRGAARNFIETLKERSKHPGRQLREDSVKAESNSEKRPGRTGTAA